MLNIFIVFKLIKLAYADDFLRINHFLMLQFICLLSINSSAFLPAYLGVNKKNYMILYDLILLHSINNISPLPS